MASATRANRDLVEWMAGYNRGRHVEERLKPWRVVFEGLRCAS